MDSVKSSGSWGLRVFLLGAIYSLSALSTARADFLANYYGSGVPGGILEINDAGTVTPTGLPLNAYSANAMSSDGTIYLAGPGNVSAYNLSTKAFIKVAYTLSSSTRGLVVAPGGDLLISTNQSVLRVNPNTGSLSATIESGTFNTPQKIALTPDGNAVIADSGNNAIYKLDLSTNALTLLSTDSVLSGPIGVDFGPDGNLYALNSTGDHNAYKINPSTGASLGLFITTGYSGPQDILFTENNHVWTAEVPIPDSPTTPKTVNEYNATTGAFIATFAVGRLGTSDLTMLVPEPSGLAILIGAAAFIRRRR